MTSPSSSSFATKSIWQINNVPSYPTAARRLTPVAATNSNFDVAVVGAGIAGLSTAYQLLVKKPGMKVVVLESRDKIAGGETERTSAHLMSAIDDRFYQIERMHGEQAMKLAAASHVKAIDTIEQIVRDEKIGCDFARVDGYLFAGANDSEKTLDKELDAAQRAGIVGVEKQNDLAPFGSSLGPCLRFPQQAQFHPVEYLAGLSRAIVERGGEIFVRAHVTKLDEDSNEDVVRLAVGGDGDNKSQSSVSLTARRVVLATNAPIHDNPLIFAKQAPYRTFVIGLRVATPPTMTASLFWDTEEPYHYVRMVGDDVLLVGGEDHKTAHADDMPARLDALERWASERLGVKGQRVFGWSGQVQEPADGMAMIGSLPAGSGRVLLATGDSGMGLTHGTIAALILAEQLALGRKHEWADIYDPLRFRVHSTTTLLKENVDVGVQLAKHWLSPSEVQSVDEVQPGSGAIMRHGVKKVAIYRDGDGSLHCHTAVCPHLGGILQFNSGEQSFDCPLHGSCFDARTGAVRVGPAMCDLEDLSKEFVNKSN